MLIEKKNTADLLPADYNPRKDLKPGDAEYEKLKRSIEQFGYVEPVIWNQTTGRVVGGHQRLKVLIDMGISEVECVVVEMPEDKEKALNIALNKISGDWDKDKLALLMTRHSSSPALEHQSPDSCDFGLRLDSTISFPGSPACRQQIMRQPP